MDDTDFGEVGALLFKNGEISDAFHGQLGDTIDRMDPFASGHSQFIPDNGGQDGAGRHVMARPLIEDALFVHMQVGDPAAMKGLGVVEKPGHVIGSFNPSYHRAHFSEGRMKVPATFRRIDGKNEAFKLPLIQSRPLKYSEPSVGRPLFGCSPESSVGRATS